MNSVMRSGLMSVGSLVGREVGVCLRGMRKALAVVATAAGMGAGLTGAAHGQVVINGIYADGGNGGAAQHADWVEPFNAGSSPVTIGGYQLLYASSTGTSWSGTTVTAGTVIQPRSFYLIRTSSIGLNGAALPNLDQSATSPNMAGGGGKLALYSTATTTSGQCPSATNLVDLVGWGTGNCAMVGGTPTAGGATVPAPSTANATVRLAAGVGNSFTAVAGTQYQIRVASYGSTGTLGSGVLAVSQSVTPPTPATSATVNLASCCSNAVPATIVLSASGGSGTTLNWYADSCGGTLLGSGARLRSRHHRSAPPTSPAGSPVAASAAASRSR